MKFIVALVLTFILLMFNYYLGRTMGWSLDAKNAWGIFTGFCFGWFVIGPLFCRW